MKINKTFLYLGIIALSFIFMTSHSLACIGAIAETQTFLSQLPKRAQSKKLVLKVSILKIKQTDDFIDSKVKVIEAIKGSSVGKELDIKVALSTCSSEQKIKVGHEYFLAGQIKADGTFDGSWRISELQD